MGGRENIGVRHRRAVVRLALVPLALVALARIGRAEEAWRDRTLRIVVGSAPGGGHDAYARLVARHWGAHIPGNPAIVVSNMPGASGVQAANYLYEVAPKDGTVVASFNRSMPFYQAVGQGNVRFKAENFGWIGSLSQAADTLTVWHTTGVRTIDDAKRRTTVIGAISKIGTMYGYPALLNGTIGTKFRIVTGYESGTAVNLAMEQGEIEGRGSNPWSSWKAIHPDWIAAGKIVPLMQVGLRKEPELANVPLLTELAENDEQRLMFRFLSDAGAIDQPYEAPPGMKPELLAALRESFEAMLHDPQFLEDARKQNLDIEPLGGADLADLVRRIVNTPREVVDKVVAFTGVEEQKGK